MLKTINSALITAQFHQVCYHLSKCIVLKINKISNCFLAINLTNNFILNSIKALNF